MSRVAQDPAPRRSCSRQTCSRDAVCTLTYVYADSTAVIGALSARREPHAYDLCPVHADALTAPRGWRVVRLESPDGWGRDDLDAVVQAVRPGEEPVVRRGPRGASLGAARPAGAAAPGVRVLRDVSYRPEPSDEDASRPGARGHDPRADDAARGGQRAADGPRGAADSGVSAAHTEGYSGHTRPIANANRRPPESERFVPLPEELRTPHLRRP